MASDRSSRDDLGVLRLNRGEQLSSIERIVVLAIIFVVCALDILGLVLAPDVVEPIAAVISIASTAMFALYLWSPLVATCALFVVFALSFISATEAQVLTAISIAAGLVLRLGWTSLVLSFAAMFLVATAFVAGSDEAPVNLGIHLVLAAVAGAIGFALRLAAARGRRLELQLAQQLEERVEQERQAVLAERRWIAGELHDSIAHHLTVVALHVQMLDDAEAGRDSQEAIRVAAKKAMTDLRFVIELADDGPRASEVLSGDLVAAVEEARSEFEAAGHHVVTEGDAGDERIPRLGEIVLARIVRESATNILKYAGPGEVAMRLCVEDDMVELTILSPLPVTPRRDLSSSRTGLARMAERVLGASGEFSAGEDGAHWRVAVRLPLA